MKTIENRLKALEKKRTQHKDDLIIREMVSKLTLEQARFCLWVTEWVNHNELYNEYIEYYKPDHTTPTKKDIEEANKLLPGLTG